MNKKLPLAGPQKKKEEEEDSTAAEVQIGQIFLNKIEESSNLKPKVLFTQLSHYSHQSLNMLTKQAKKYKIRNRVNVSFPKYTNVIDCSPPPLPPPAESCTVTMIS
ncbi:hypothetical protein M0802_008530 [Mischocyttarus mexicanus]|nr:hypothetical protein M0802_008530 [Mischocyttarus mexicanus]